MFSAFYFMGIHWKMKRDNADKSSKSKFQNFWKAKTSRNLSQLMSIL
uniref:Uncharacterized protein n=1 Tax=Rhizophora mucronata TaxID=61149 RepID=A0A2P2P0G0_RHIMU